MYSYEKGKVWEDNIKWGVGLEAVFEGEVWIKGKKA